MSVRALRHADQSARVWRSAEIITRLPVSTYAPIVKGFYNSTVSDEMARGIARELKPLLSRAGHLGCCYTGGEGDER